VDRASVGRNEPCPCGSGRKYKQCCLNKDETKARQARAKAAAKEAKAAKKSGDEADEKGTSRSVSDKVAQPRPSKAPTYQPWKKSATNTHAFQRMSTPRKVGGGG
jgi:hypothetical protein